MSQPIILGYMSIRAVTALTPIWLLGLGLLAGMILVVLLGVLIRGVSIVPGFGRLRRAASEFWTSIHEGVLFYVLILFCVFAAWGVIGTFLLRPISKSTEILGSLTRLTKVGEVAYTEDFSGSLQPKSEDDIIIPPVQEFPVSFIGSELRRLTIRSSENISVSHERDAEMDSLAAINVKADETFTWHKRPDVKSPFGTKEVTRFYVRNRGADTAHVTVTTTTETVYPQVWIIPITAVGVFMLFALYFLQFTLAPRLSAIALATFKSEIAQPLFTILLLLGIGLLVLFIFIPYNTFGEDIKMLKDSGVTLIRVIGIALAVWGASTTISEEVEGRTALTVLSKPIGRRSFVLGKFSGIAWTAALMFIVLGIAMLSITSIKTIYDAREASRELPIWQECYVEMVSVMPGLLLAYMETLVLAALSVAISTRLPMFANFVICFTVYVLGHITPLIVQVTDEKFEIVKFIGQLIATIVPNLEAFDLQTAIAAGLAVPSEYLLWALLYCLLFSGIAMLLALVLFEDRDLA